jgi:hypothetical protein
MKLTHSIAMAAGLVASASAFAMSSTPPSDPIKDFQNSWAGKALAQQRNLDVNSPLADNSILGTHNSYNSEAYRTAVAYIDPQQKHSIYDQLRLGARFIELDAHWTAHTHGWPWQWGTDLLLCHSGIGAEMGDLHVGCSLTDRFVKDGLQEVRNWLNENPNEVIILYFEDHTDGHHQELLNLINDKLSGKVYASNGCKSVPNTLTKAQVRAAGKQVVLWKDGGCSNNAGMKNLAFTGLGDISRTWEDRTAVGAIGAFFGGGSVKKIDAGDVTQAFKNGVNIVNLDDMTHNDGRIEAAIWSWDRNEPNNWGGNQDCALQWGNGRWDDAGCTTVHHFACQNNSDGSWNVSTYAGQWNGGAQACAQLGNYRFAAPTNSQDNEALKAAKGGISHVWLNASDRQSEGTWVVH